MKKLIQSFGVFLFLFSFIQQANAYVTVSGNVSGEYWHNTNTYYVSGNLTVDAGTTFEIQSGTRVKFAHGTSLTVYGTFIADGNSGAYITFTSMDDDNVGALIAGSDGNPEPGDWTYIYLYGSGTDQGIGNMDYCKVLYAGAGLQPAVYFNRSDTGYFKNSLVQYSGYHGFRAEYDTLTVTNSSFLDCDNRGVHAKGAVLNLNNSTFNNNEGDGIYATSASELQINNCQFNNNDGYAARLVTVNIKTYTNNSGSGNTINAFGIAGNIYQNITLSESGCGFPYVLIGDVELSADYTLTIPAGDVIKVSGNYTDLIINGTLNAIGTASDSIVFTSLKDDTHGGDLNGDGSATTPAKADWSSINLYGSGTTYQGIGNMNYCKVLYAGEALYAVNFYKSDEGYFTNSLVQYSGHCGFKAQNDTLTVTIVPS